MQERVFTAAIIALGLAVSSFLIGGRYTMIHGQGDFSNHLIRLDRYTGTMSLCGPIGVAGANTISCGTFSEEGLKPTPPPKNAD